MGDRFSSSIVTAAIAAAAIAAISASVTRTPAQAPVASSAGLKTPWGEPDLQGIWTDEFDTPFQRPARYANQEFFTEAQRAELDKKRSALLGRLATERELAGGYNLAVFTSVKRTGARTSLVIDPPNGRIPGLRRWPPPIGNFASPCCKRPKRARPKRYSAMAGNTIPCPRRDARSLLLATSRPTSSTSIAMMVRRTARCWIAA
jgi:hypothetical protein